MGRRHGARWYRSTGTAIVLAFALLVAACGDDSGSDDDAASDTTTSDAPAPVEDSRFTGTDAFCTPAEGEPSEAPTASDDGITADTISLTHVRLMLEDLEEIGFAVDLGDQNAYASTFIDILNEECGGINGRQVELENVEVPVPGFAPDAEAAAQEACIAIAEEQRSVAAWSNSGVGVPLAGCLTGPNDVIFMTTYDLSATDFEESEGRLFSVSHSPTDILRYAALELTPDLEGKRIGIVHGDTDPDPQVAEEGLVQTLEDQGLDVVRVDTIGCPDGPPCTEGLIESAQGMLADEVDVMFPLLDTTSLPGYLAELVTQGAEPGDIQFYNTSFLAQDSELVTGKIIEFGGEAAADLYNGAVFISGAQSGQQREDDFEPDPFTQMCNEAYAETSGQPVYDPQAGDDEARFYSSVSGHCAFVRMLARGIEAAGPNPTRADIAAAIGNLGDVDLGEGAPGSFTPGKPTAPDAITRLQFQYPCQIETDTETGHCVQSEGDFLPIPEG
ncbi:MAG: ABC transporter substrate-binding protein [Acidimicrobiales bacterium]